MWSKLDGKQALSSALSKTYFGDKYIIVGEIYMTLVNNPLWETPCIKVKTYFRAYLRKQ